MVPQPPARHARPATRTLVEAELVASVAWLISLRWVAGAGVLLATGFIGTVLHLRAPEGPLYAIGAGILVYNLILYLLERRLTRRAAPAAAYDQSAKWQMALDWLAMTLLIHFSGGIESPVILFFVFHIIVASIFFPARTALAFALIAVGLVSGTTLLEFYAILPHEPIVGLLEHPLYQNGLYAGALLFFFASTGLIAAYLASSINERLRQREEEIVRLSERLQRATARLQELDAAKSRFVRMVTHELRSPVSVTRTLLRTIAGGYVGAVTPQQQDFLERATRRVDFLHKLIDDLLDLAAGKADLREHEALGPVTLEDVLERVGRRFEVPAQEKGLTIEWHHQAAGEATMVMATPDGLDRVFDNLVSNAVKYTPSGGRVTLTLSCAGPEATIAIEDTGMGIPREAMAHLFEEFYRAPNARALEREGTGLGLTITRDILTRFGGRVSVHSTEGVGTCFTVTLPTTGREGEA